MKKQNNIEELFKDKLQNIEADPGANAWANIQSGLSGAPAATTAAASSWVSTAIVAVTITAVAIGGYFLFNKQGEKKTKNIVAPIEETKAPSSGNQEVITEDHSTTSTAQEENEQRVSENSEKEVKPTTSSAKVEPIITNTRAEENEEEVSEETIDEIIAKHQARHHDQNMEDVENETNSNEVSEDQSEMQEDVTTTKHTTSTDHATLDDETNSEEMAIVNQIIFPNVFSPNSDGRNDRFVMDVENSIEVDHIKVYVFDKTGKLMNEWSGVYNGWDGKDRDGNLAKKDSYIYKAIILKDGKEYLKLDSFTLLR